MKKRPAMERQPTALELKSELLLEKAQIEKRFLPEQNRLFEMRSKSQDTTAQERIVENIRRELKGVNDKLEILAAKERGL